MNFIVKAIVSRKFRRWMKILKDSERKKIYRRFFNKGTSFNDLVNLHADLNQFDTNGLLGLLPKDLTDYENYKELYEDIPQLESGRHLLITMVKNGWPEDFMETGILRIILRNHKKPLPEFKEYREFKWFAQSLGFDFIYNVNDQIKSFKRRLKESNRHVKVLYKKKDIYIFRIKSYKAFYELGLTAWCIKEKGHWEDYVKPGRRQYGIVDFNVPSRHRNHAFSYTQKMGSGKIKYCYDNNNSQRDECDIQEYLKLI